MSQQVLCLANRLYLSAAVYALREVMWLSSRRVVLPVGSTGRTNSWCVQQVRSQACAELSPIRRLVV